MQTVTRIEYAMFMQKHGSDPKRHYDIKTIGCHGNVLETFDRENPGKLVARASIYIDHPAEYEISEIIETQFSFNAWKRTLNADRQLLHDHILQLMYQSWIDGTQSKGKQQ